ncbi:hypothetical protein GCM10027432_04910 [Lysobacter fragariae]
MPVEGDTLGAQDFAAAAAIDRTPDRIGQAAVVCAAVVLPPTVLTLTTALPLTVAIPIPLGLRADVTGREGGKQQRQGKEGKGTAHEVVWVPEVVTEQDRGPANGCILGTQR